MFEADYRRKRIEIEEAKFKSDRIKDYLNSIPLDIEPDLLEEDVYDFKYMVDTYSELIETSKNYDGRYTSEKIATYINTIVKKTQKTNRENEYLLAWRKFQHNEKVDFGLVIGRTNNRYDHIMRLKIGPSYQPKFITKEQLITDIKNNVFGLSKGFIV